MQKFSNCRTAFKTYNEIKKKGKNGEFAYFLITIKKKDFKFTILHITTPSSSGEECE